ncbi:hypothetical protein Bealeia1_02009 (plasmid) [Candidatus Bealeia paramacronuclearis]|uniref:Uncharacterized protein n=1 Tax=Candidatus Bealeia paramacronuclearis TaxID=1921001 RepID=A0ABZ2C8G6_9PROT
MSLTTSAGMTYSPSEEERGHRLLDRRCRSSDIRHRHNARCNHRVPIAKDCRLQRLLLLGQTQVDKWREWLIFTLERREIGRWELIRSPLGRRRSCNGFRKTLRALRLFTTAQCANNSRAKSAVPRDRDPAWF